MSERVANPFPPGIAEHVRAVELTRYGDVRVLLPDGWYVVPEDAEGPVLAWARSVGRPYARSPSA